MMMEHKKEGSSVVFAATRKRQQQQQEQSSYLLSTPPPLSLPKKSSSPHQRYRISFYLLIFVILFLSMDNIFRASRVSTTECQQQPTLQLLKKNIVDDSSIKNTTTTTTTSNIIDSQWCPNAQCHNTILCHPCRRRFLIVIASGRSASTTLTWMLDALPGVRMSGENWDLLGHMYETIDLTINKLLARPPKNVRGGPKGRYPILQQSHACATQHLVEVTTPPPPPPLLQGNNTFSTLTENGEEEYYNNNNNEKEEQQTIIGFKTIRFVKGDKKNRTLDEIKGLVDFVKVSLPCSRIIVNIRSDIKSQAKSKKKAFLYNDNIKQLASDISKENELMKYVVDLFNTNNNNNTNATASNDDDQHPNQNRNPNQRAILIDSTIWTKNITQLNDVVRWLGFSKQCQFYELLEYNTKKFGYGSGKTTIRDLHPNCQYIGVG